jgi:hypothetical protein
VIRQPRDVGEAAARLAALQGVESDPDFEGFVAGMLMRLEELGLARRA